MARTPCSCMSICAQTLCMAFLMSLVLDIKNLSSFVSQSEIEAHREQAFCAYDTLFSKSGAGKEFLGWLDLPSSVDKSMLADINQCAKKINSNSQVLVVIGIGGSYLGARAAIEFLKSHNYNMLKKDTVEVHFVGNNMSANHINDIISIIGDRDFSVNVISKSGTTTEPAIAFRLFKKLVEDKYGKQGAKERIYATTDKSKGALKKLSDAEGYKTFVIPDNVGGRYSVLTPVGLLPIAACGVDIEKIIEGAAAAQADYGKKSLENPALLYAAIRNILYKKGKTTEILACFEPQFKYMAEWFKQLFGESEGKENKGIFPASVDLSADLHSLGQYIQSGLRNIFETVVNIKNPGNNLVIDTDPDNMDGLNFLSGKDLNYVNHQAFLGTMLAHMDGGVPNISINIDAFDEDAFGRLVYFFEISCAYSGYILGINPFDQPGVEDYKINMFSLLGKPGFEGIESALRKRL